MVGKVIDDNDVHDWKAFTPIVVTEFGIVKEVREEQDLKELEPIDVTDEGIVIDDSDVHV